VKKNWEVKRLGEVSKINYGYTEKASFMEIGPKFLRITDIQDNKVNWETVPFCQIPKNELHKYLLNGGDIVFARTGATTGKSFLLNAPPLAIFASYLIRVQILEKTKLTPEFLFLFFQTKAYWDKIEIGLSGSAQGGFNATKLGEISIPLPPLPEQQRIVAILNNAFSAITKAKENTEKNLQSARELFQTYLQSVFVNSGEGWEVRRIEELCQIKPPKKEVKSITKDDDLVSFVPMEDLGILSKYFIAKKERRLKDVFGSYTYFSDNDVLLAKITPCFENGKIGIACNLKNKIGFGSSEFIVFRSRGQLIPDYLYYFLVRDQFRKSGEKVMSGAVGHKRVPKDFIENQEIPYPKSLPEQRQIAAKLDALSLETKKLQTIYQERLAQLEALKKSLLQKAFNGELTEIGGEPI
jgi:type I restriction enzyme, S subunit